MSNENIKALKNAQELFADYSLKLQGNQKYLPTIFNRVTEWEKLSDNKELVQALQQCAFDFLNYSQKLDAVCQILRHIYGELVTTAPAVEDAEGPKIVAGPPNAQVSKK